MLVLVLPKHSGLEISVQILSANSNIDDGGKKKKVSPTAPGHPSNTVSAEGAEVAFPHP